MIAHIFRDDTGREVGTEGFYLGLAEFATDTVVAEVDDHIKAFRENSAVIAQAKGMTTVVYGVTADRARTESSRSPTRQTCRGAHVG